MPTLEPEAVPEREGESLGVERGAVSLCMLISLSFFYLPSVLSLCILAPFQNRSRIIEVGGDKDFDHHGRKGE